MNESLYVIANHPFIIFMSVIGIFWTGANLVKLINENRPVRNNSIGRARVYRANNPRSLFIKLFPFTELPIFDIKHFNIKQFRRRYVRKKNLGESTKFYPKHNRTKNNNLDI